MATLGVRAVCKCCIGAMEIHSTYKNRPVLYLYSLHGPCSQASHTEMFHTVLAFCLIKLLSYRNDTSWHLGLESFYFTCSMLLQYKSSFNCQHFPPQLKVFNMLQYLWWLNGCLLRLHPCQTHKFHLSPL